MLISLNRGYRKVLLLESPELLAVVEAQKVGIIAEKFFKQRRSVERNVLLLRSYLNERKEGGAVNSNNVIALSSCVR